MDSMPVVFDVSSDEEGWGEARGGGEGGDGGGDDSDWISELLDKFDREADDSDDVVLVDEVVLNPKPRSKSSVKDLDDDCVVLDGNPDKSVVIENNAADDSDDLVIVGEKGQIACRDYPHPRHLCAEFPFTSTPHERLCHQCHCYVCDSLAPCVHWGNGTSIIDHCHATDKDEFWKLQRRNFKEGEKPTQITTSNPMGSPQTIEVPPLTLLQPDSLAQKQASRPTTLHACSASANSGIPNITSQGRNQQSVHVLSRNKFRSHLVPQQLPSTRNNIIRREGRHNVGNLGHQFINSQAIFKRAGSGSAGVTSTTNRSGFRSSNTNNHVTQYSRNLSPMTASNEKNSTRWPGFSSRMTSDSNVYQAPYLQNTGSNFGNSLPSHRRVSSQPNMGSGFVNSVPSQPRVLSQSNLSSSFVNSASSLQASFQQNMGGNFENSVPSQLQVPSLPSIGSSYVNSVPSLQASSQPNLGSNFVNSVPSQLLVSSQPNMGCSFVHPVPSQPQVYSQDGVQQGNEAQIALVPSFSDTNEAQIALDPSFSDFNTSWDAPTGLSNQQSLVDDPQIQSAMPTNHHPLVTDFDSQIPASTNLSSLDFQFVSWMLDDQPVSGDLEISVPSGLNVYSPEPAPLDAGFLFDF